MNAPIGRCLQRCETPEEAFGDEYYEYVIVDSHGEEVIVASHGEEVIVASHGEEVIVDSHGEEVTMGLTADEERAFFNFFFGLMSD